VFTAAVVCELFLEGFHLGALDVPAGVDYSGGGSYAFDPTDEYEYPRFREREYRFQTVPVFNLYEQPDGGAYGPQTAHITSDDGYLVTTLGVNSDRHTAVGNEIFPVVYQAWEQDETPFGVPLNEIWMPEYKDSTKWVQQHLDWTGFLPYPIMHDGAPDGAGGYDVPSISRQLGADSMRAEEADTGYRFSTRVKRRSSAYEYLSHNFLFDVEATNEGGGQYGQARCRMVYNGSQVDCRIWDEDNGWESAGVICDVDPEAVNDFHIVVQNHQAKKFRVLFAVKSNQHASSDEEIYNFLTDSKVQTGSGILVTSPDPMKTSLSCTFDNPGESGQVSMEVHQMGWGLIQTPGVMSEYFWYDVLEGFGKEFASGQTTDHAFANDGVLELSGVKWRPFSDVRLFNYSKGSPSYTYRMSKIREGTKLSSKYHWPNGFEFYFSGESAVAGDRWTLDREVVSNTSDIQQDLVHGYYTSDSDDTEMYLWADSEDSGLMAFEASAFMVTGTNVPEITIVGKDDLNDPWEEVSTIDLRKYEFPSTALTEVNHTSAGRSMVKIDSALYKEGRFSEFQHYLGGADPLSANRAGRVASSFQSSIWVDTDTSFDFSTEDAELFVDRGAEIIDEPVKYRFIGIRIDPYHTHEGRFRIHSFDFGRPSVVPLKYGHDIGTGASQEAEAETNFVFDEQPYTVKKYSLRKEFDLSYSVTDAQTLSKLKSVVREIGVSRKPVWVLENNGAYPERVYRCFIDGGAAYTPLVDEDGEKYYEFEVAFRSAE
jgi:hypothetical protein